MGVPAFFRWLTRKYPSVIVDCIEDPEIDAHGNKVNIDSSQKNPNGVEIDNLYLDMNGIIHPCTHPENKPAPKSEDEMMIAIFECIDRLFKIVRPRKLLYLAIDGVAPRAKMNQQRSRRFRAAKETAEKAEQIERIRTQLAAKGIHLPPEKDAGFHFDSNCITPGTSFMSRLTECLNYYIHDRISNDPGWKKLKVILSDASVPGEGEHKIMDFIRKQRAHPDHDPNTHHCLCGADADLIMLGLATHEPHFTIIREEFVMNQPKRCEICGLTGHEMTECKGLPSEMDLDLYEHSKAPSGAPTRYIFVRLNVLREYLERELSMPDLPFEYDFDRALDDWVFMCFFVGNDFLPHLPSLEIREGAIDRLVGLYKKTVYRTGGFITTNGDVNLDRVQMIMTDLGILEDEIFRKRQKNELMFRMRNRQKRMSDWQQKLRETGIREEFKEDEEPHDEVRLWEEGYKERYYKLKFNISSSEFGERHKIGLEYVLGLCWVLKYYYQGCASWKWYFPYHYAPFASDFVNIAECNNNFERGTSPFTPLEQLMSVFPAGSSTLVPPTWADLMINPLSSILDFYPKDFMIDLNGKRFAWQGVALLPFVDENRLRKGLTDVYKDLTSQEVKRNKRGNDRLYIGLEADCFSFINNLDHKIYQKTRKTFISEGVFGEIFIVAEDFFQGEVLTTPVKGLSNVEMNAVICVGFCDPLYPEDYIFKAVRLAGAEEPPRVLKSKGNEDSYGGRQYNNDRPNYNQKRSGWRPMVGMAPATRRGFISNEGHRMLGHAIPPTFQYYPLGAQASGTLGAMRNPQPNVRSHPYRNDFRNNQNNSGYQYQNYNRDMNQNNNWRGFRNINHNSSNRELNHNRNQQDETRNTDPRNINNSRYSRF